jgi:hypothetical protein
MRLVLAAAFAWLGLAVFAQSALATHGRIQVAKVNQGGNPNDTFAFDPSFSWTPVTSTALPAPAYPNFSLKGGEMSQAYDVGCSPSIYDSCPEYSNVTLQFAESPTPGYTLTDITCRHTQTTNDPNNTYAAGQPTTSSPIKPASEATVDLAAGTVNLKVNYNEWVVCWFTNTYTGAPTTPATPGTAPSSQAPSPQVQVSPARVTPGSAKLRGPHGCPDTNAVAATVTGRKIAKVTFYVDNKKVKTLTKPNKRGRWVLSVNMRKVAYGSHRVEAKVEFTKSSGTKTKRLRLSFNRCGANNVRPQFTG